jgi:hypothetical protein
MASFDTPKRENTTHLVPEGLLLRLLALHGDSGPSLALVVVSELLFTLKLNLVGVEHLIS